jgi:hypothetical protein
VKWLTGEVSRRSLPVRAKKRGDRTVVIDKTFPSAQAAVAGIHDGRNRDDRLASALRACPPS